MVLTEYQKNASVETKPGTMYWLYKVHKQQQDSRSESLPILLDLKTPTSNLARFSVRILNTFTKNELTLEDSFQFAEEI